MKPDINSVWPIVVKTATVAWKIISKVIGTVVILVYWTGKGIVDGIKKAYEYWGDWS